MGKFGWSLPPGCSSTPGEEMEAPRPRCHRCGRFLARRVDVTQEIEQQVEDIDGTLVTDKRTGYHVRCSCGALNAWWD